MVELISKTPNIKFMKLIGFNTALSCLLIGIGIWGWIKGGEEKYGVDFVGGAEVVVEFSDKTPSGDVREALKGAGYGDSIVQAFEGGVNQFSIRVHAKDGDKTGQNVGTALGKISGRTVKVLRNEFVGPIIGEQIRRDGIKAVVFGVLGILIYMSFRFSLQFAMGGIVAMVHDVLMTGGLFVLSGRQVSGALLAAILTIIGYSINDTIIVFDRVRENLAKATRNKSLKTISLSEVIDHSVNQTLSRTILTSATVFIVACTLWLFGGGAVSDLAFAMVIGVVTGTYSSIFVAAPYVLFFLRLKKAQ